MTFSVGTQRVDTRRVIKDLGMIVYGENGEELLTSCPWPDNHVHGEANVNASVNTVTGLWVCFKGCGGGGGSLENLVRQVHGLSEVEARRWLLTRGATSSFDMVLEAFPTDKREMDKREREEARQAFKLDLERQDLNKTSSYILERGFTPETLRAWGFRYDSALPAVVIPVYDSTGDGPVGVIRRLIPPISVGFPKYLFSPGFDKARYLFGADHYERQRENGQVIVVEGPLDAIWLHQHGYTTAVALLGASCSKKQQRILRKLARRVILSLDNDSAGVEATGRLLKQLGGEFQVQVTVLFGMGKDVQELNGEELEDVFGSPRYEWQSS